MLEKHNYKHTLTMDKHHTHHTPHTPQERDERRKRNNRIWLTVGAVILCAILLFWLFAIGTFEGPNQ